MGYNIPLSSQEYQVFESDHYRPDITGVGNASVQISHHQEIWDGEYSLSETGFYALGPLEPLIPIETLPRPARPQSEVTV